MLTAVGLTLVATLLASWLIARRFSTPLIELAAAAREFQAGNYSQRVVSDSTDEIGTLTRAFDEMSRSYVDQLAQMQRDREELRTVLTSMVEGVLVVDRDQRVQFFNDAALRMLGIPAEVSGNPLWRIVRSVLGSVLGFQSRGIMSWIVRMVVMRWGWSLLRTVLRRAFTGR